MKKFVRNLLLAAFVLLGAVPVFLTACGGEAKHTLKFDAGEGIDIPDIVAAAGDSITPPSDPEKDGFEFEGWYLDEGGSGEKQSLPTVMPDEDVVYYGKWTALPQITLSLGGGTLAEGDTLFLKAGEDLYTFMQQYIPQKDGVKFGAWKLGEEFLSEGDTMPAGGVTLTAAWKQPVSVTLYTLDFATYEEYVAGDVQTAYAYAGEAFDAETVVPEHYTLNTEKTGSLTVQEGANELGVYVDPVYTLYTDVFESTDYLYELETEAGTLYLDRIGMESGRKKSSAYNSETGIFSFETDSDFTLSGKIVGEKFYYFRDTIEKTFPDYFGTEATLSIVSPQEVTYTPAGGNAVQGSYSVDIETGRYIFTPASGEPFEFVLIEDAGIVSFRLSDGVEGWYAYGGELAMGGWSILYFDGFGYASYLDDEGLELDFDYTAGANGIIDLPELGRIQITDSEQEDVGGHEIKGTFVNSDGYEGSYTYVQGYNTHTLTLDGFGGALYHSEGNGFPEPVDTVGSYSIEKDESWLIYGYNNALGIYMVGEYSGVNELLVFTGGNTSTKYLLSESVDEEGIMQDVFKPYSDSDYDFTPGAYPVTNSITYKGTAYPVDDTHQAFLYFHNNEGDQVVDLWYGSYEEDYEDYVFERILYGGWLGWINNLYNSDLDYDGGMDFSDLTEEGTFEYLGETYEGEVEQHVFFSDDEVGTLIIDALGVARFTPAGGEAIVVDYKETAIGLIRILSFTFPESVPKEVSSLYAVYSDKYLIEPLGEEKIYDLNSETCKMLEIGMPDGTEDGSVVLVVTPDLAFVGCMFVYDDGSELLEFVLAGTVSPVDGSENEYTFTWDDSIYYDELDYIEDSDYIVEAFGDFRYQELQDGTFLYYDGYEFSLTAGENSFVSDGYGSATLTLDGTPIKGYYTVEYNVVTFDAEDGEEYTIAVTEDSFTVVDFETETGMLYGFYYAAVLSEEGLPEGITSSTLFMDGAGGFVYETVEYSEEDYDYTIITQEGTYRYAGRLSSVSGEVITLVIELTFAEDDVREGRIIIYDYYGDGGLYGFFVIRNEALMGEYDAYTDDGAELGFLSGGDGYLEESALFVGEDRDGEFSYEGYMARGTIEDNYYDQAPQFTADPEGDVVVFVTYVDDDMIQYVFDISDEFSESGVPKVYYRDKFYGAVAEYKVVGGTTGNYLYLDGHSKATLYNAENQATANGTYEFVPDMEDTYAFKSSNLNFIFQPSATIYGGTILYIYSVYGSTEDIVCINDDWSILSMDGFGGAAYIDRYGTTYTGEYYKVIENEQVYCLKVENSTQRIYYELNEDGSFALCSGDFLVRNGVLYSYFGADESIKIPDEVTEIAEGAFILSGAHNIKHINFNKVTKIADKAFYGATSVEEIVSENILEVGVSAFENIWSITRVELPNATKIGDRAFYGCKGLKEVKLGKIASIGAYAFTRSIAFSDSLPLTLDLTAVEDFTKLSIDFTAFLATRGTWGIVNETVMINGSKILVGGGLASLNAAVKLFKGKTASIKYHDMEKGDKEGTVDVDLSGLVTLVSSEETKIAPYYSLAADTLFLFEDGILTEYKKGDYSYEASKTHFYYVADGKVIVYAYNEGNALYEEELQFATDADSFTIGSVTAVKEDAPASVTVQADGKDVVISYTVSVSVGYYSISVSLDVTAVTYDGTPAENVLFSSNLGTLTFNANGHGFEAKLENGTFTVTDLGRQIVLTDKTFEEIYFRLTIGFTDDGSITLVKLEVNSSVSYDPDGFSDVTNNIEEGEAPNTWQYKTYSPVDFSDITYQLQVTEQGGEYTLTVTVVPEA